MIYSQSAVSQYLSRYTGQNGNNDEWYDDLVNTLLSLGCMGITDSDFQEPASDPPPTSQYAVTLLENYIKKKEQFMSAVRRACGRELRERLIGDERDPKVIWNNITQFVHQTRESNPVVLRQRMYAERMGSSTAQQFVNRVMMLRRDVINAGDAVSDSEVIAVLIGGLPHANVTDDFHTLVSSLKVSLRTDAVNTTLAYVIQSILNRDSEVQTLRELSGENPSDNSSSQTAMFMRGPLPHRQRRPSHRGGRGNFGAPGSQGRGHGRNNGQSPNCWFCNQPGHFKDDCSVFYDYLVRNLQRHNLSSSGQQQSLNVATEESKTEAIQDATPPPEAETPSFTTTEAGDSIASILNALDIVEAKEQGW